MSNRISLSLVIPTKDKLGYLSRTIVFASQVGFDEIVVIDSSIKEQKEIEVLCRSYGAKYYHADLDRLAARNYGAYISKSDWVAICDDDIIVREFDMEKFSQWASKSDFLYGGWGANPTEHYAWIFRRDFFIKKVQGYDPDITGGDDLDTTLRSNKLGSGIDAFKLGIYRTETIGLNIARDYPNKWIRNKVHYSLTVFPLVVRHKRLILNVIKSDVWRFQRILKGEPALRIVFESIIDRAGLVYSPLFFLIQKAKRGKVDKEHDIRYLNLRDSN
jgi:glycosyltransferase involved in cell wall biosynthesis